MLVIDVLETIGRVPGVIITIVVGLVIITVVIDGLINVTIVVGLVIITIVIDGLIGVTIVISWLGIMIDDGLIIDGGFAVL